MSKQYKLRIFVGGARKTCKSTEEGLPKLAHEIAKFLIEHRNLRLRNAIKAKRSGYILHTEDPTPFELSRDSTTLAAHLFSALKRHVDKMKQAESMMIELHKPFGVDPRYVLM